MPPAVVTANLIAVAARALHEGGHQAVAQALMLFLAGAGFEDALGLRPGWRAHRRYETQAHRFHPRRPVHS